MKIRSIGYLFLGIFVISIDQLSKFFALTYFLARPVTITPLVTCHVSMNRGISWGMLNTNHDWFFVLLLLIIILVTFILFKQMLHDYRSGKNIFGYVLVIAGSTSNCIDRLHYHGVVDFIICSYKEWSWPVFNVADVAIVIGVCIMLLQAIRYK